MVMVGAAVVVEQVGQGEDRCGMAWDLVWDEPAWLVSEELIVLDTPRNRDPAADVRRDQRYGEPLPYGGRVGGVQAESAVELGVAGGGLSGPGESALQTRRAAASFQLG